MPPYKGVPKQAQICENRRTESLTVLWEIRRMGIGELIKNWPDGNQI
ncbi:hypothetical protein PROFUN_15663 [Planoprotostelium fungivorum]|uniref:Uncharacterized protein n=1 Tax=Planoprotostelium fungivorum TaxID=1890364 RepID=A0A2P6MUZ5_9EUKA|nr:hypothetical protein PROFUN_15663 [Planoprotostelium fungivorum]